MHVRWLEVVAFRNYAFLSFRPDPGLNILTGPNGQGKTSVLEAVALLLTGRSFRTARAGECVAWGAGQALVAGELAQGPKTQPVRLTVWSHGGLDTGEGLCPWGRAVTFSAGDLLLVTGSPGARRAYLDGAAAKLVPAHGETCRRYRLVLQQRGRLLAGLRGRKDANRLLEPWDEQVATLGSEILHRRIETLARLAGDTQAVWRLVAADDRRLELAYVPATPPGAERGETARCILAALSASRGAELTRGLTMAGPHRDDVLIRLGPVEARSYASRGEQRLIALALRLGEAAAVRQRLGARPVLLLDDALSELDTAARARVLAWLGAEGQVVLSTTDGFERPGRPGVIWEVRQAGVRPYPTPALTDVLVAGGAA